MGKDCRTCGYADGPVCSLPASSVLSRQVAGWFVRYLRRDRVTARKGAPDCPGWTEDDRVTASPEPPEANQLREAQRERDALTARVRELEATVTEQGHVIAGLRAKVEPADDWFILLAGARDAFARSGNGRASLFSTDGRWYIEVTQVRDSRHRARLMRRS